MSDTHPNAFRFQAEEKRLEAIRLNNEADALEAQAKELDNTPEPTTEAKPVVGEPKTDAPKGKLFTKK